MIFLLQFLDSVWMLLTRRFTLLGRFVFNLDHRSHSLWLEFVLFLSLVFNRDLFVICLFMPFVMTCLLKHKREWFFERLDTVDFLIRRRKARDQILYTSSAAIQIIFVYVLVGILRDKNIRLLLVRFLLLEVLFRFIQSSFMVLILAEHSGRSAQVLEGRFFLLIKTRVIDDPPILPFFLLERSLTFAHVIRLSIEELCPRNAI